MLSHLQNGDDFFSCVCVWGCVFSSADLVVLLLLGGVLRVKSRFLQAMLDVVLQDLGLLVFPLLSTVSSLLLTKAHLLTFTSHLGACQALASGLCPFIPSFGRSVLR